MNKIVEDLSSLNQVLRDQQNLYTGLPKIVILSSVAGIKGTDLVSLISAGEEKARDSSEPQEFYIKLSSSQSDPRDDLLASKPKLIADLSVCLLPPVKGLAEKEISSEFNYSQSLTNESLSRGKMVNILLLSSTENLNDNLAISFLRDRDPKFERSLLVVGEERLPPGSENSVNSRECFTKISFRKDLQRILGAKIAGEAIYLARDGT